MFDSLQPHALQCSNLLCLSYLLKFSQMLLIESAMLSNSLHPLPPPSYFAFNCTLISCISCTGSWIPYHCITCEVPIGLYGRANGKLQEHSKHGASPKTAAALPPGPQWASADPCLCSIPSNTNRQVWFSLLWGHCSFLLGPNAQKILFVSIKNEVSVSPSPAGFL